LALILVSCLYIAPTAFELWQWQQGQTFTGMQSSAYA
jgi:hypothetical protein